ncbi:MAG: trigger factor family protein, partial [Cytophagales bacterium]|nr:trigger factor family protein [Cytophagales bacterium]
MEITLEKQDAVNGKIKINLTETDYLPQYQQKLKEFSKKASIKGFRPGKVPAGLINKMYGKSIMVDEMNRLVSDSLQKYIDENKLQIVGNPIPDQMVDSPEDFFDKKDHEFAFRIGMVPEFTLATPPAKAIVKYAIQITDERIKEAIEEVKSVNAASENVDEVTSTEDMVFGDLKEINGSYSTFGLIPLNKVFDSELKKFMGKKIDEEVIFDVKVAFSNDDSLVSYATGVPKEKVEDLT